MQRSVNFFFFFYYNMLLLNKIEKIKMAETSREISSAMDENHDEYYIRFECTFVSASSRFCLSYVSATPWLRSPTSIVVRRVITLTMRLGT